MVLNYFTGPEKVSVGSFPEAVTSCPGSDGFSGEIWFPFCWDGSEDFDPSDPYAHVVFGDGDSPQGGKCSGNHTKPLPQLFMEFHHDISAFASKPQAAVPWVLAQGDGTGYGMHADFVSAVGQTCWRLLLIKHVDQRLGRRRRQSQRCNRPRSLRRLRGEDQVLRWREWCRRCGLLRIALERRNVQLQNDSHDRRHRRGWPTAELTRL